MKKKKTTKKATKSSSAKPVKKTKKPAPKKEVVEETSSLDNKILDEAASKFEKIVEACYEKAFAKSEEEDPTVELLIALAITAAEICVNTGFEKDELLSLMQDVFEDVETCYAEHEHEHDHNHEHDEAEELPLLTSKPDPTLN